MTPKGWNKVTLKEILEGSIKNGFSPIPAEQCTGYWVLGLGALSDDGLNQNEIKPVEPTSKTLDSLLSSGDFLVSRSNTPDKVGRSIRFKGEIANCSYPDLMMRFRINERIADVNFIEAFLKSSLVRDYYKSCAAGSSSTMVKINKAIVENTPLVLPSITEQEKIAKILGTWDQAIATTEKLLTNSQQQKKALMQKLLTGRIRFPEFSEQWQKIAISSILKEVKRPVVWNDNDQYKLLSVKRRCEGIFFREELFGHQILTKKMNVAHAGDFLISKMQVVHGAMGLVGFEHHEFHVSDSYISLEARNKNLIDVDFFWWFCNQKLMAHKAYLCSYGVHIEKMTFNLGLFLKEKIFIPKLIDEQKRIAKVLTTADREIATLQQKLACLKQEKKALMQQLLTGKRRVKADES